MDRPTIVIIEDDLPIAQMYSTKFEYEGYNVKLANDGESGIDLILREHPVVILLDVMMPNMNGMELLNRLQQYPEAQEAKILVLTNMDSAETHDTVTKMGAVDCLIKAETTPDQVAEKVKELLVPKKD